MVVGEGCFAVNTKCVLVVLARGVPLSSLSSSSSLSVLSPSSSPSSSLRSWFTTVDSACDESRKFTADHERGWWWWW